MEPLHVPRKAAKDGEGWKSSRFWFSRPAEWKDTRPQKGTGDTSWAKDATPIGNGRIGALIYGGVGKDHLELTEISMWSGGFCSSEAKDKGPGFPEIRVLSAVWNAGNHLSGCGWNEGLQEGA